MSKIKVLKAGTNEELLAATRQKVDAYMKEMFNEDEIIQLDDIYSFSFGTISVNVEVRPWHSEDVLVEVYAYLADDMELSHEQLEELLRLNARMSFGAFGLSLENSLKFSYALAGKNLDMNEISAAIQNVAVIADQYDEQFADLAEA